MQKRSYWIGVILLSLSLPGFSQKADTLKLTLLEALNLAVSQNPQLRSIRLDEEINRAKIKEVKSSALPQVTADASFTDNYSRATQLLPGDFFGQPGTTIPVRFGTRYVFGGTAQLRQKVFDPSLNIGIKAAKESQGLYELQTFKSKEDLVYNVITIYMQLQMTEKQQELVAGNLERMKQLMSITKAQYKEGIVKKVEVDQLNVNYTNLQTQLSNTENSYRELLDNLKTLMNVDVERPVALTEIGAATVPVSRQLQLESNTDLNLLDYQMRLQKLNTRNIKAGYLPSLSLMANYGWQGQSNTVLKSGGTQGFTSGLYSLGISIPIFDGFTKKHKITQSELAYKQMELNKEYLTKNIQSQFKTASNNVNQNQRVLKAQQENMKLAEELYSVSKLSYTEGVASLSELINAENGLKEAQTQYLTAMLRMNLAELDLMQSSGQLSLLIKNDNN